MSTAPRPDEACQMFTFGDMAFRTLIPSAFSSGISLFVVELAAGCLSGPLHVHDREDGLSYVLDGSITFQVGGEITTVSAGAVVELPRGVPHTFWNAGSLHAKALDIVIPGGLENYYQQLAHIADDPNVMDQLESMEDVFGIHMDWDSVPTLMSQHGLRMAASL